MCSRRDGFNGRVCTGSKIGPDERMAQEWPVSSEDALGVLEGAEDARVVLRAARAVGERRRGCGLLATRELEAGATALVLPWRSVLGARAAVALLRAEEERGSRAPPPTRPRAAAPRRRAAALDRSDPLRGCSASSPRRRRCGRASAGRASWPRFSPRCAARP